MPLDRGHPAARTVPGPQGATTARTVRVDLRHDSAAARLGAVRAALEETQLTDTPRFVVVDDARDLVNHQLLYEQLFSYGPAHILCLAAGTHDEPLLRRPPALRPPATGVLWIPDASAGAAPGGSDALRPLVELLLQTEVFDAVLGALGDVVHGTAVPAVRVVEHELTDDAATRAWRQALDALVGQEVATPTLVTEATSTAGGDAVPAELAPLLGESVPRSLAGRTWLLPDGTAAAQHQECDEALRELADGCERVRGPAGLFAPASGDGLLAEGLERLSAGLADYRETIAGALVDGGGDRLHPEQRGRLLKRGIALPEAAELAEASRATIGPGLRRYTERLLGRGLPLRSVAARLGALSDRSAPAGSAVRLARLDEICPPGAVAELAVPVPFVVGGRRYAEPALAALIAALAGLWPGLGWAFGPLTGLAVAGLAMLMVRRRPNRSYDGRIDGGGRARTGVRALAGVAGGLAGAAAGSLFQLPLWASLLTLLVALVAAGLWAVRDWGAAVDDWWERTDAEFAGRAVSGIDALLAETVVQDWVLGDARYHCSDGAQAVARLVRSLADTAGERLGAGARAAAVAGEPATGSGEEDEARALADSWSWDSWGDSAADDDWSGLGGAAIGSMAAPPDESAHPGDVPPGDVPPGDVPPGDVRPDGVPSDGEPPHHVPEFDPQGGPGPAGPEADPAWLERERGGGGASLVETLAGDLAQGVVRILSTCWAGVERDPAAVVSGALRRPMDQLLDEEHEALLRDGAASPPSFAPDTENRPGAAELLGVSADRVARLLGAEPVTDHTVPLCRAEHRRLLSKDPLAARQVRFAPEAMRRGAEPEPSGDGWHGGGADGVVWTPGGRHAGVLRLVPLRGDTVRTVRTQEDTAP